MCQKDACGAALTVPYNFILTFLPGTYSGRCLLPASGEAGQRGGRSVVNGREVPAGSLLSQSSPAGLGDTQLAVTQLSPLWTGALLLGDGPVTQWQEPKFPKDFREDSCPPDLEQPRWEQGN